MHKQLIKQIIEKKMTDDGVISTNIKGVQFFRVTQPMRCAPAVYEPCVIAIVSGAKEAILGGKHYIYDENQYMCCPMSMPVEAGTPNASPETPLLGVMISLDTKVMTELAIEMATTAGVLQKRRSTPPSQGLVTARWDDAFSDALLRLLQLSDNSTDSAVLGDGRLREFYYAVLKGDAGMSARNSFAIGNEIARTIDYLSSHLHETVTIDNMATQLGMSRAVLHRKFKEATSMSPIQFVKSMRLNTAAMKIAAGMNVSAAAMDVGYVSSSQFSREFKRLYGQSPKQWRHVQEIPKGVM